MKADASIGFVEISESATWQPKAYHSRQTAIKIALPIEPGETPEDAVSRVREIALGCLNDAINDEMAKGWNFGQPEDDPANLRPVVSPAAQQRVEFDDDEPKARKPPRK